MQCTSTPTEEEMPTSLSDISTKRVIVRFQLAGRDRARLAFVTDEVEQALSGNERLQRKICKLLRQYLNKMGGRYTSIAWSPSMMVEFFEDSHELEARQLPTEEEIAEARYLLSTDENYRSLPLYDATLLSESAINC